MKNHAILLALLIVVCSNFSIAQIKLDSSLVIHLPFDTTLVERIANLTLINNGASWDRDRNGNKNSALRFDGKSNLNVKAAGIKLPENEITVTLWARTLKTAIQSPLILNADDTKNRFNIHLHYYHNGSNASFWDFGNLSNSRVFKEGINLDTTKWEFYTFTSSKKDGKMKIYRNNSLTVELNNAGGFTSRNGDLMVGGFINQASVNLFYYGLLDDVRIYGRVITADERNELYKGKSASLDFSEMRSTVYPNPFQGTFQIESSLSNILNVKILNVVGEEVDYLIEDNHYSLLHPIKGVYFVEIKTEVGTEIKKMLLEY